LAQQITSLFALTLLRPNFSSAKG